MFDYALYAILTMRVVVADVDGDNYTYLLERVGGRTPMSIAFTSESPLPIEGGQIQALVDGECGLYYGVNEEIKHYWSTYRAWVCNAKIISTGENKWENVLHKPSKSESDQKTRKDSNGSFQK
jgi:hypothetical protein